MSFALLTWPLNYYFVPLLSLGSNGNLAKTRSLNKLNEFATDGRIVMEEKEQALLAANETVQVS